MKNNLNFGQALEALKNRQLVSREGWNGKGMFLFIAGGAEHSIPKSEDTWCPLPRNVFDKMIGDKDRLDYKVTEYICMKAADGTIVNGWLASQTDMLAKDWCILD